jgi:hypothetical protein
VGFPLVDRGVHVVLVQELFLIFRHELRRRVALELPGVVRVGLPQAPDFLIAFLGAGWDVSIRFYGEIVPWKLSFRVPPHRKIILCCILRTLYHRFNLFMIHTGWFLLTQVHLVLNPFIEKRLHFLAFFTWFFIFLTARRFLIENVVGKIVSLGYWGFFAFMHFDVRGEPSVELNA